MGMFRFSEFSLKDQFHFDRFLSMFTLHMDGLEGNLLSVSRRGPWTVQAEYDICRRAYRLVVVHKTAQFMLQQLVTEEACAQYMAVGSREGMIPIGGTYPPPQERNYTVQELLELANAKLDEELAEKES